MAEEKGIDDALQPNSGHSNRRQSLEVYSKLAITVVQEGYEQVIGYFPEDHISIFCDIGGT